MLTNKCLDFLLLVSINFDSLLGAARFTLISQYKSWAYRLVTIEKNLLHDAPSLHLIQNSNISHF